MENDTYLAERLAAGNTTRASPARSGYDLPVYGLDNGQFYVIHVAALICILSSFCCALTTLICSFRSHKRRFFLWSQSDRIVVYLAFCDLLFNVSHSMDHLHYALQRGHVTPPALCAFYGFMLSEFISAQNLLVHITAINACLLVYRRHALNFGTCDWRLLSYTFGTPFVFGTVVAAAGGFGPTGTFCYFDAVHGTVASLIFTTMALGVVLVSCAVLYVFTWLKIYREARHNERVLGHSALSGAVLAAAKTCLLLVAAFFVQWWAMALYGTWQLVQPPPQLLFQFVTTFSNTGGVLNLIVFCIIYRRRKARREMRETNTAGSNTTNDAMLVPPVVKMPATSCVT
ncbi:uncharacterized protein LOC119099812 [Pollicipes pollicipes]|uniref:uncharacterized protein LOC119099812 n=1 Tax=Pollicipes pollicipes TaxID=41117 RepID=UPI001884B89F|nr:uncharacterized protein LOC119099812 [Pollicipes pollicipes]